MTLSLGNDPGSKDEYFNADLAVFTAKYPTSLGHYAKCILSKDVHYDIINYTFVHHKADRYPA